MNTNIKRGIVTGALSLSLLGGSVAGVAAQQSNQGGAAGLVAAVVQANLNDTTVEVIEIEDSLNNLTALNNFLNNSPITVLQTVTVTDVVTVGDITVDVEDVLNQNNIAVQDVVEINLLSGGDLLVQTQ
jgi:hypothetical protein